MAKPTDDNQKYVLEEALERFVDLQLWDKAPDVDEFLKRYPELEPQIRKKIRKIQRIHALFDSLVEADESDFEDAVLEPDLVGRKIAGFEIVKMIGRGGMGVVYLARDSKLKRSVAVKSMPAELQADPTARKRLRREAELLASLNHPNIAVIHDIIEESEDADHLVLEYVPGQTLAELIAGGPLGLEQVLSIARQVAAAVSAAHKEGIIHRDLKPGNIKITLDGNVKVLDFGLAKPSPCESTDIEMTVTEPGHVIGTPAYMSPEQARGKDLDHRTDIWSFGCIMYEMLTGQSPYEGQTATDTLARIIEREPDWTRLPKDTPANLKTLMKRCLEKDPDRRLGDIADAGVEISDTPTKPATALGQTISARSRPMTMVVSAIVIIALTGTAMRFGLNWDAESSVEVIRLVVLPFKNLGSENDDDYSSIISAEIIGRLVGIHGLAVSSEDIAENRALLMGKAFGVDYVLKGTVQCVQLSDPNNQVMKIRPQLIRVSDGQYVWAEPYDNDLSQIYQIPSEMAEQVVQAMNITLLEPERRALQSRPTENMAAYVLYLRGNYYHSRSFYRRDWLRAIQLYEDAIDLDPTFASAYARLSRVHSHLYWDRDDHSKERLDLAERAARKALELDPGLPEAHLALGFYHYWGHRDYDRALEEFAIVQKSRPDDSDLLFSIGLVQRRQGKLDQALANFKRTSELEPLSHLTILEIGYTLVLLRRYSQAERYYDLAISLVPDLPMLYYYKAVLYWCWQGRTEQARAVLEESFKATGNAFVSVSADLDVYDGNYLGALDRLSLKPRGINNQYHFRPLALRYAIIYWHRKEEELAKKDYRDVLITLESKIAEDSKDERFHSALGIAYAGLGEEQKAIKHGKLGVELMPASKDAVKGPFRHKDLALIYVMLDKPDAAIDELEYLLSIPGELSIPLLRKDPAWESLRNHPRFKRLIESGK